MWQLQKHRPGLAPVGVFREDNQMDGDSKHDNQPGIFAPKFHSAELVFAVFMVSMSIFLATQYDQQTKIVENKGLFNQPGFWSWFSIATMIFFSIPYLYVVVRKFRNQSNSEPVFGEVIAWITAFEFVGWFLGYVMIVPVLGYLPATVGFAMALTFRMGYREWSYYKWALVFAIINVLFFRSFLSVNIPAGAIYEYLPSAIRYYALQYI